MIFSVENGRFGYKGADDLWHDVNFEVRQGEVLSILGPNGVGKTTLLKCCMGFLKWRCGASKLDGTPITSIPHKELWQKIAYVPQAKNAGFSMTALEMVLLGRNAHMGTFSQPSPRDYELAHEMLADLGIEHLTHKLCSQVSGGELQMILLARALASQPEMLILDEPESNLDFKNQLIILETMTNLAHRKNIACIFNTHYPSHALSVSDKALLLCKQGEARFGDTEEIITESNMREAFQVNVQINHYEVEEKDYKSVLALSIAQAA